MSLKYNVTKYSFIEPDAISEQTYLNLKLKLNNDHNFSLVDSSESITKQFSWLIKFLFGAIISLPIGLLILLTNFMNWFSVTILLITVLWSIGGFLVLMMSFTDLHTYAKYLRKKRDYFNEMATSIQNSKDYDNFFDNFYK